MRSWDPLPSDEPRAPSPDMIVCRGAPDLTPQLRRLKRWVIFLAFMFGAQMTFSLIVLHWVAVLGL